MAFLEDRLNPAIGRSPTGGPVGARLKAYAGGRLQQSFLRSRSLQRYDISNGIKTAAAFEEVRALFYVVMFEGYAGFRFKDWSDYTLTQTTSTLKLIAGSTWQIHRRYTAGITTHDRKIEKTVAATVTVYRTRAGAVSTASATVDHTTGVATITGHTAGDTYTCEGQFDVPVTFLDDALDNIRLDGVLNNLLIDLPSITLEEIRL